MRAMLVSSSPSECTLVTFPPWYQSQTITAKLASTTNHRTVRPPARRGAVCSVPARCGTDADRSVAAMVADRLDSQARESNAEPAVEDCERHSG